MRWWADSAHCWFSAFATLALVPRIGPAWTGFALALWVGLKELVYDPAYEGDPILWGGARDIAGYLVGAALGLAAVLL